MRELYWVRGYDWLDFMSAALFDDKDADPRILVACCWKWNKYHLSSSTKARRTLEFSVAACCVYMKVAAASLLG